MSIASLLDITKLYSGLVVTNLKTKNTYVITAVKLDCVYIRNILELKGEPDIQCINQNEIVNTPDWFPENFQVIQPDKLWVGKTSTDYVVTEQYDHQLEEHPQIQSEKDDQSINPWFVEPIAMNLATAQLIADRCANYCVLSEIIDHRKDWLIDDQLYKIKFDSSWTLITLVKDCFWLWRGPSKSISIVDFLTSAQCLPGQYSN